MATTIELVDGTAFQEAIASVRNDATEDNYVLCGHVDGDPNRIQVNKRCSLTQACTFTHLHIRSGRHTEQQ